MRHKIVPLAVAVALLGAGFGAGWVSRGEGSGLRVNGGEIQEDLWEASPGALQPPRCRSESDDGIGEWLCLVTRRNLATERVRVVVREDGSLFGKRRPQNFTACCVEIRGR